MLRTIVVATAFTISGTAFAEEVIIEREAPAVVVPAPAPSTSRTTVEKHGPDCDSKTVHSENGAGDSKTVTREDCN